uniref:Putative secreted protein n=1 Tax=Amblyomma parvum TaxID=251391 RepID=A0A023G087_AMBPA
MRLWCVCVCVHCFTHSVPSSFPLDERQKPVCGGRCLLRGHCGDEGQSWKQFLKLHPVGCTCTMPGFCYISCCYLSCFSLGC